MTRVIVARLTLLTACPYFGAKALSHKADLVLCPYNYLLDPGIREAFKIDLQDAVVIFDEAQYGTVFSY